MPKTKNLGEFEILVLAALVRLGDEAYGVNIRREIEDRAGRTVSVGALYATLTRMEDKTYVRSRIGEATAERGGRAKKYFELTASGRAHLDRSVSGLKNMLDGIYPWHAKRI